MKSKNRQHKPSVAQARAKLLLVTHRTPYNHNELLAQAFTAGLQAGSSGKQPSPINPMLLELVSKVSRWL